MAGARPRELLGLEPRRIEAGRPADFVLFESDGEHPFALTAMMLGGELV
jgi:hypothetical protein